MLITYSFLIKTTMELEIQKKVERFIELSKLFSKTSTEVFGDNPIPANNMLTYCGSILTIKGDYTSYNFEQEFVIEGRKITIGEDNVLRAEDNKPLTRAQEILLKAEFDAQLSNNFDEYRQLQKDLEEYFTAKNNLLNK